jgi:hypothetical protein
MVWIWRQTDSGRLPRQHLFGSGWKTLVFPMPICYTQPAFAESEFLRTMTTQRKKGLSKEWILSAFLALFIFSVGLAHRLLWRHTVEEIYAEGEAIVGRSF